MDRRLFLRMAASAGIGAALLPRLALAAAQPDRMAHVEAVVARWVGTGHFPGLVASLGLPGQPTQFVARGMQAFTDGTPMSADSLFRIYSMTKPITGIMAMQLIAEGRLGLDQPLAEILPEYAQMQVQNQYDGSITALHPAPRAITIRQLLTHTSGLGYSIVQKGPIAALMRRQGLVPGQVTRISLPGLDWGTPVPGLEAFAQRLAKVPLVADPGTAWHYSMGLDLMGRVIEVVTGQRFDAFLRERLFAPAGMASTSFQVSPRDAHRLTTNYGVVAGHLVPIDPGETSVFLSAPAFPFGGSGLVSSPRDYDRFLRLLAQGGMLDGRRILSEQAVRVGTSNLLPPGVPLPVIDGAPRSGFGAGGRVGLGAEAGIFGWSGAAGTVAMVDMVHGYRSQLFAQFMPPNALGLLPEFQRALKADIMAILETS
ncbi:serine hydrolase domain-containing protein [Novosphingobium sp. 9]|uniref:serine hydrolase domain-containing protein n=1 Tax=Novosphingobium sp. 9 TaxID=2025349 RepID=UPI0021B5F6E0|nr:serine hydrolase domain-containing protein [Novosphingobium sp. 9]